jgi:hypothetical protein
MYNLTFKDAKHAFDQGPTSTTAWNYLVTAVEYGADGLIDQRMFTSAVGEVLHFVDESSRSRALVERLLLASASIRLACAPRESIGTGARGRTRRRMGRVALVDG